MLSTQRHSASGVSSNMIETDMSLMRSLMTFFSFLYTSGRYLSPGYSIEYSVEQETSHH